MQHRDTSTLHRRLFIDVVVWLIIYIDSSNDVRLFPSFLDQLFWVEQKTSLSVESSCIVSSKFINRLISSVHRKDSWRILNVFSVYGNQPSAGRHIAIHSCCQCINGLCAINHILKIFLLLLRISSLEPRESDSNITWRFFSTLGVGCGVLIMFDLKLGVLFNFHRHLFIILILLWRSLSWIFWLPHRAANFVYNCFFIIDMEGIIWFILS